MVIHNPQEIERRSMEIIGEELARRLGGRPLDPLERPVIQRVIHTTADFDYLENLVFSEGAVEAGLAALREGASILTDTEMAKAGINKSVLASLGGQVHCLMGEEETRQRAEAEGTTRAVASIERAADWQLPLVVAIGNAPTALLRLAELIEAGRMRPRLVIGVPVGFVNVLESKEAILRLPVPSIVARGRKGGSTVAAAICNALLYQLRR